MLPAERTIFTQFQLTGYVLSILVSCIILSFAFRTLKGYDFNRPFFLASHIVLLKAPVQNRTADLNLTMVALYRLSYKGKACR